MMEPIDEAFVRKMDGELIEQDVKLHARPFQVVVAWMRENQISGDFLDKSIWGPVMETYKDLYPKGDFSMPAILVGGVAFRDQMYLARANLGYGTFAVDPLKCIDITREELELIFEHHPEQGWRAFYAVCDVWDFGYGVDDVIGSGTPAKDLFMNARSSLAATPRILAADLDIDSSVQTTCLTAELSIKGALKHLGAPEKELKSLSHCLPKLAETLSAREPRPTDSRFAAAAYKFPNYVGTRYASHGLTRVQLMDLAMRAQFIAAEAVRRISGRNMAGEMEARLDTPPRGDL
jgi:hypothetical protein